MRRFEVATVSGYHSMGKSGSVKDGLSAHVIDRLYLCQVVRTFRSERSTPERAIQRAQAYANELNRG